MAALRFAIYFLGEIWAYALPLWLAEPAGQTYYNSTPFMETSGAGTLSCLEASFIK